MGHPCMPVCSYERVLPAPATLLLSEAPLEWDSPFPGPLCKSPTPALHPDSDKAAVLWHIWLLYAAHWLLARVSWGLSPHC